MIIEDVARDLRDARLACIRQPAGDGGNKPWLQGFVNQHVRALGGLRDGRGDASVAAHHRGAALVGDAIAISRGDGCVIDGKGGDDKAVAVPHHAGAQILPGKLPATGGHDRFAMMGGAITGIGLQQQIVTGGHVAGAGRADQRQRCARRAAGPAQQQRRGQAFDMIAVQMGEQHGIEPAQRHTEAGEFAHAAIATIDQQQIVTGLHHQARLGALRIGHGRTGAAEDQGEAVAIGGQRIASGAALGNLAEHKFAHRRALPPQPAHGSEDQQKQQETAHEPHARPKPTF